MTAAELQGLIDLDCRVTRKDGTWCIACRSAELEASAPGDDGLAVAARKLQAIANDEATGLTAAEASGYLMAVGVRRLARLRALVEFVSALVTK